MAHCEPFGLKPRGPVTNRDLAAALTSSRVRDIPESYSRLPMLPRPQRAGAGGDAGKSGGLQMSFQVLFASVHQEN